MRFRKDRRFEMNFHHIILCVVPAQSAWEKLQKHFGREDLVPCGQMARGLRVKLMRKVVIFGEDLRMSR